MDSSFVRCTVDRYPPTSGGLYGVSENGYEWVSDQYDPDCYARSPRQDLRGPGEGIILDNDNEQCMKVHHGSDKPSPGFNVGLTFFRDYATKGSCPPDGAAMRCAVNVAETMK